MNTPGPWWQNLSHSRCSGLFGSSKMFTPTAIGTQCLLEPLLGIVPTFGDLETIQNFLCFIAITYLRGQLWTKILGYNSSMHHFYYMGSLGEVIVFMLFFPKFLCSNDGNVSLTLWDCFQDGVNSEHNLAGVRPWYFLSIVPILNPLRAFYFLLSLPYLLISLSSDFAILTRQLKLRNEASQRSAKRTASAAAFAILGVYVHPRITFCELCHRSKLLRLP